MSMNKKIKEKWLKALRSGKFTATNGRLKDRTGYCCLGVLCEVMGDKYDGSQGYPLLKTLEKAGLTVEMSQKLALMNDNYLAVSPQRDFKKVIRHISRNL